MKIQNVQALRGIAAVLVVGAHLPEMERKFTGSSFVGWFDPIGSWGVDLFFVISGFVMLTSTWNFFATPNASGIFFLRRVTRIFPIYWLVLIPLAALDLIAPSLINGSQTIRPSIAASFLLLPQQGKPLLTVSWTLVYEMYFYYIYTFLITRPRRYLFVGLGTWIAFTLLVHAIFPHPTNANIFFLSNTITIEFLLGAAIAQWCKSGRPMSFAWAAIALGAIAIFIDGLTYVNLDKALDLGGEARFFFIGVPMAAIFYGVVSLELEKNMTLPTAIVALGDASYSLYLWHVPILISVGRLSTHLPLRYPAFHVAWLVAITAFAVAMSVLLFRLIEMPMIDFFGKLIRSKTERSPIPAVQR